MSILFIPWFILHCNLDMVMIQSVQSFLKEETKMAELLLTGVYPVTVEIAMMLWYRTKKHRIAGSVVSLCFSMTMAVLMLIMKWEITVPCVWLVSHILFMLCGLPFTDGKAPLQAGITAFSFDAVWWPLVMCKGLDAVYKVLFIAVAVCILYLAVQSKAAERDYGWSDRLKETHAALYMVLFFIPLVTDAVSGLLLAVVADNSVITAVILTVTVLIIYALLYVLQFMVCRYAVVSEENAMSRRSAAESREYMNTIRAQRHDFNLHLHAITGLIGSRMYDECQAYIDKLVESASEVNEIMPVYDAVIGSMLYNMRQNARDNGTDIHYDIKYDMKDIVCNPFECNKILGNLIQNALDAIHTDSAREYGVRVSVFKRRGNTVIAVSNRFEGDEQALLNVFNSGYTTKSRHEGIGLTTTEAMLKKHSGKIHMELEDGVITFIANIPNRLTFEGEDNR